MDGFERNKLKHQLEKEESFWDNIISTSPFFLGFICFLFQRVAYDLSFCLQDPLPEYVMSYGRVNFISIREVLVYIPYIVAMYGLLLPSKEKRGNGVACTVDDYGPSRRKLPYWLLLATSIIIICVIPVFRISDFIAAWVYRISFLSGIFLLFSAQYALIRIAFRNKINQTCLHMNSCSAGILTLFAVLIVVITVIIHRLIIPSSIIVAR